MTAAFQAASAARGTELAGTSIASTTGARACGRDRWEFMPCVTERQLAIRRGPRSGHRRRPSPRARAGAERAAAPRAEDARAAFLIDALSGPVGSPPAGPRSARALSGVTLGAPMPAPWVTHAATRHVCAPDLF